MPENIGPQIGVQGYQSFRRQMDSIVQVSKELASEMKAVTSAYDKNDQSQEKLAAQMGVLDKQIQNQSKRVELLGRQYQDAEKRAAELNGELQKAIREHGETSKEAERLATELAKQENAASRARTEYNNATAALNKMGREMADLENQAKGAADGIDDVADSLDDVQSSGGADFGDILGANAIVDGASQIISAIGNVVENTKEYREIMASLEVSSEKAGYTAEETAAGYDRLFGVLGDEQQAATTLSNLQQLGADQETLNTIIDSAVGAWATYGDSLPIDGLAEAINETVRTGTVTGQFADVLNWGAAEGETFGVMLKENTAANEEWNQSVQDAETAEDYFNLALEEAGSQGERLNLVMQAMAKQGLAEAGAAWQTQNEDIIAANQAQADFAENAAALAERVAPATNAVQDGFNKIFAAILEATEGIDFNAVAAGITGFFDFLIANGDTIIAVITGIGGGMAALKIVDVVSSISSATSVVQGLTAAFPALSGAITALTNPVFLVTAAVVGLVALIATKGDEIQAMLAQFDEWLTGVFATDWTEVFGPVLGGAFNAFFQNIENVWNGIKQIFDGVIDFIRGVFTGDWDRAWKGLGEVLRGIVSTWAAIVKAPINGIIGILNAAIGGINSLIDGLNRLRIDIPDWVPGIGGGTLGFNIPHVPTIPLLASGGVLLRGAAIVGEAGPELLQQLGNRTIVQPLSGGESAAARGTAVAKQRSAPAINITINTPAGMDVNALADAVAYRLQTLAGRKEAVW